MDTLQVMETTLTWVEEIEVPKARQGGGPRDIGPWADIVNELRTNPNKWAVIAESLDSGKVTALRYRFPDIDFRGKVVSRVTPDGKKMVHQKVWACYHEAPKAEEEPTVTVMLTASQVFEMIKSWGKN